MRTNSTLLRRSQQGAALVVGLVLLLVLTVLAVTGMNTASTELIMAANTQYQENAFQASEVGIERVLLNANFVANGTSTAVPIATTAIPNSADTFKATIYPFPTEQPMLWGGATADKFSTYHFQVQSQGDSRRNATTVHTQGLFVIGLKTGDVTALPGGATAFTAP